MCFSLEWIQHLLILAVIIAAIFAVLQILVPWVLSKFGANIATEGMGVLIAIFKVIVWAVVIIFIIYVAFALISCLWSWGGGSLSLFPHH